MLNPSKIAACGAQCPPVAAGETPYTLDPGGQTCSRPDQYKLTLTPDKATIEPGKSYTFTATVTKQDGSPPSIPVSLSVKVEVDSISGGHAGAHTSPRPKGSIAPTSGTNALNITFTSTEVSGKHTITAICDMCANSPKTAEVYVKVKEADEKGWGSLIASPSEYELVGGEEGKKHHDNHYLTATAQDHLTTLIDKYNKAFPAGPVLYLNDASLEWGGEFDISGKWGGAHDGHRRGREIDVRANQLRTAIPFMRFNKFKSFAAKSGAFASIHCSFPNALSWACAVDTGSNRHFHVYLSGK